MPVLSKEEFQTYFVNPTKYGDKEGKWPHETLIVYKCEWDIERDGFKNKENKSWSVVRNETGNDGRHAERIVIRTLKENLKTYKRYKYENFVNNVRKSMENLHLQNEEDDAPVGFFDLKVYLSYSPCSVCSKELIEFVRDFHKELDVVVSISFSTFYKHKETDNWKGLLELLKMNKARSEWHKIELTTLGGERWNEFFDEMQVKGTHTKAQWKELVEDSRRKNREDDDTCIFRCLQIAAHTDLKTKRQCIVSLAALKIK